MSNFSMKFKFLLVALIPMIIATTVTLAIVINLQAKALDIDIKNFHNTLIKERKSNINDTASVATAVVEEVVERMGTGEDAKEAVRLALSKARYSDNDAGYFFIFDNNGTFIVHSLKPQVEGKPGMGLTDPNGIKITVELQKLAKKGGGFVEYIYDKPGYSQPQPKIAYSSPIANSGGWFLGTGLYTDDIIAATEKFSAEAETRMYQQVTTVVVTTIVLVVIVIGLMFYISSKITAPIRSMLANFKDIANGDGDLTIRINASGSDEIAQLGNAFDQFIAKLHTIMSDVSDATYHVTSAASSINTQTSKLQHQLEEHNHETEQVVTAITEMNSTAQEVARNTNEVASATNNANQDSQNALRLVDVSNKSISSLESNVERSNDNMSSLQEQSHKIDNVLKVIGEIAEQTNLLALNAAIEAARAGEQGRGFAVVADEVRSLASRTQDSTLEIKQMLDELHSYVQQAVISMNESKVSCGDVVSSSSDITEGLNSVGNAVEAINSMTVQIATAATQQSSVTDEINQNLVAIREIVSSLLESSHDSSVVANELADAGKALNELVGQFKL
ncbi:methyl-accepting chemotaxis protein [Vibrio sp. HN007]|uniref:methyl-accepting chemotaxis protein n=1 Tax=Vibrio iocasae TaxID=3098914 RepID=UPI0035D45589